MASHRIGYAQTVLAKASNLSCKMLVIFMVFLLTIVTPVKLSLGLIQMLCRSSNPSIKRDALKRAPYVKRCASKIFGVTNEH